MRTRTKIINFTALLLLMTGRWTAIASAEDRRTVEDTAKRAGGTKVLTANEPLGLLRRPAKKKSSQGK